MSKGGTTQRVDTMDTARYASVCIAAIVSMYALFVGFGLLPAGQFGGDLFLIIGLVSLTLVLSLFFYVKPVTRRRDQAVRIIGYHALLLALCVTVIGFWQPFLTVFILLFVASRFYFGNKGLLLSILSLLAVATLDTVLRFTTEPSVVFTTGLPVLAVIVLGLVSITIITTQESKQQELVHSRRRERLQYDRAVTIMNNLSDASLSTDEHGKIMMYNAASLDLLDTNDSLKGKLIGDVFKFTSVDVKKVNIYKALKAADRTTRRDDIFHTYSDGESIRLEITYAPIRSNYSLAKKGAEMGGYIFILRDVTKQKSLEEERDEFISVVSHELRTPITIAEGSLSNLALLASRPEKLSQKILHENISTAHDQVLYLSKMVNDLSTLSRAERGVADTPESIDVSDLLITLHKKYTPEAEARGLYLNIDLGPKLGSVSASRLYLEELLQNFVTNAIKYTHQGSVTIHAKKTKGVVAFEVSDTGIGISRTEQNKVFHKFYRSEDYRIRETNGTGLGLYVSAKLARKLGTEINLTSRLNHGSTFSFTLPAESADLSS